MMMMMMMNRLYSNGTLEAEAQNGLLRYEPIKTACNGQTIAKCDMC